VVGPPGPCGCGCALDESTSEGFDVIDFAEGILRLRPYPWQRWLFIHALELNPDGTYRFGSVLVLIARQNGKSTCVSILAAYWQFVAMVPNILYTSTKLSAAKKWWTKTVRMVQAARKLNALRPTKRWTSNTNGEEKSWTNDNPETGEPSTLSIAASNAEGGRGDTNDRVIQDELREHHDYTAWDAAVPSTVESLHDPQVWNLSNAGSDRSVVLNDQRDAALRYATTGEGNDRLFIAEWSTAEDADPLDPRELVKANPSIGYGPRKLSNLLRDAGDAVAKGGEKLTGFKTEYMCVRVKILNPAIDAGTWRRCLDPGTLDEARNRLVLCVDVSPDQLHAAVVAAGVLDDGRVRIEPLKAYEGPSAVDQLRTALPDLVAAVKPKVVGWFPNGPAASMAADLADRRKEGRYGWPPPGVTVEEIRGELTAACMGFAEQATAGKIAHSGDPLLDAHVAVAERLKRGDAWVFSRKGAGHVDALYAAAGAAHLARTLPKPIGKPRLVVVEDD
jgi:hypothetical protein